MTNSYLKFLSRNKFYTAVEAVGLVISIAFVILIGNYVVGQYRVAYENPDHDRIYTACIGDGLSGGWWDKQAFEKIPEVECAARYNYNDMGAVKVFSGEDVLSPTLSSLDVELFDLFPYLELSQGSLEGFSSKDKCLVSESFAQRIAKDGESVVGKVLEGNVSFIGKEKRRYEIAGIVKDFSGTLLRPADMYINAAFDVDYTQSSPYTSVGSFVVFAKVIEGVSREDFHKKIEALWKENYSSWNIDKVNLYSLDECYFVQGSYLLSSSDRKMLNVLLSVVLLLLACAIFNYINLNTALSVKRAHEMATRRLLGASRKDIVLGCIDESVAFTLVCFLLALLLAVALVPSFNRVLSGMSGEWTYAIPASVGLSPGHLLSYLLSAVAIGAMAGAIPSMFASRYAPVDIVSGAFRRSGKMIFSKVFIVLQNTLAVFLLSMSLVMSAQMRHLSERPLHARSDGLFYLRSFFKDRAEAIPLIDRLEVIPSVGRVGRGHGLPGRFQMGTVLETQGGEKVEVRAILCDSTFFSLLDVEKVEDMHHPSEGSVWLSESLSKVLQLGDSTESYYARAFNFNLAQGRYIGGIYRDMPVTMGNSPFEGTESAILISENFVYAQGLLIEVLGDEKDAREQILSAYRDYCMSEKGTAEEPKGDYLHKFLEKDLSDLDSAMRLVRLFTFLSLLISILGLVAMGTYFSGESTRQIAIRKVFGSDVEKETARSVKSYATMVLVSCVVAIPVAVFVSGQYLRKFSYRIEGYWWMFVLSSAVMMAVAILSVIVQVLKAARSNPSIELKKD